VGLLNAALNVFVAEGQALEGQRALETEEALQTNIFGIVY
jgi:hypothetical protein